VSFPGVSMMDIHGALSTLLFAVNEEIEPWGQVSVTYDNSLYLQLVIETRAKHMQRISDILMHGVLWGPFNYRFRLVSMPQGYEPDAWVTMGAKIDMHYSRPPSGPIDYNNTPSAIRRRQQEVEWGWHRA